MSGRSEPGPEGQRSLAAWAGGRLLHIYPNASHKSPELVRIRSNI
jgi:hypothetical protein